MLALMVLPVYKNVNGVEKISSGNIEEEFSFHQATPGHQLISIIKHLIWELLFHTTTVIIALSSILNDFEFSK